MADATARALVDAESRGLSSHGMARIAQYAAHLRNGRVVGTATPHVAKTHGGAILIDARMGLAFPACTMAVAVASALRGQPFAAQEAAWLYFFPALLFLLKGAGKWSVDALLSTKSD